MPPERGERCLLELVLAAIPVLATWGPLAPENRAPTLALLPGKDV